MSFDLFEGTEYAVSPKKDNKKNKDFDLFDGTEYASNEKSSQNTISDNNLNLRPASKSLSDKNTFAQAIVDTLGNFSKRALKSYPEFAAGVGDTTALIGDTTGIKGISDFGRNNNAFWEDIANNSFLKTDEKYNKGFESLFKYPVETISGEVGGQATNTLMSMGGAGAGQSIGQLANLGKVGTLVGTSIPNLMQEGNYLDKIKNFKGNEEDLRRIVWSNKLINTALENVADMSLFGKLIGHDNPIIPTEKIQKKILTIIKNTKGQAITEGATEVLQGASDVISDKSLGLNDKTLGQNLTDIAYQGTIGGLTGGVTGAGATGVNALTNQNNELNQENITPVQNNQPTLLKGTVENLVQSQTIVPDNTPVFSQLTETEKYLNNQDKYNQMVNEGWGNIDPVEDLHSNIEVARLIRQSLQNGVDLEGNNLTEEMGVKLQGEFKNLITKINENKHIIENNPKILNKYSSPSPQQLLGQEQNPEANQAIANEYQAQGELYNEYSNIIDAVLGYYPSLESFKGKAINDFNNGINSDELNVYRNLLQYENLFNEKGIEHHNLATLQPEIPSQLTNTFSQDESVIGNPITEETQGIAPYNPVNESVEYYKPNQPLKNKIPDNLRLMAEHAQQYDKYSDWLNSIKKEGAYTTKELSDEVKNNGFQGLKHFFNKRNNIQPLEYQDLPQTENNVFSKQENIQPEMVNKETITPAEIQPTQEEIAQVQAVENIQKEIEKRKVKKVEKRREELINKAADENITPEEAQELVKTEIALQNIKKEQEDKVKLPENKEELEAYFDKKYEEYDGMPNFLKSEEYKKAEPRIRKIIEESNAIQQSKMQEEVVENKNNETDSVEKESLTAKYRKILAEKWVKDVFIGYKEDITKGFHTRYSKDEVKALEEIKADADNQFKNAGNYFIEALLNKDFDGIYDIVQSNMNKSSIKIFAEVAGIPIPRNQKEMLKAVYDYVGWGEQEIQKHNHEKEQLRLKKEEDYANKRKAEELKDAIKTLESEKIKVNDKIISNKEFIDGLKDKGYTLTKTKQGIKPVYKLYAPLTNAGYWFTKRPEKIYIDSLWNDENPVTVDKYKLAEEGIVKLEQQGIKVSKSDVTDIFGNNEQMYDLSYKDGEAMAVPESQLSEPDDLIKELKENVKPEIKNNEIPVKRSYNKNTKINTQEVNKYGQPDTPQNDRKRTGNTRSEIISESDTSNGSRQGLADSTGDEYDERAELDEARGNRGSSGEYGRLTESDKVLVEKKYKNRKELNNAIKQWIENKGYENYTILPEEIKTWLKQYTGQGGVKGAEGKGILDEYYTPEKLVNKMWDLAKSCTDGNRVFEPSMGIGRFFEFAPQGYDLNGVEYNETSGQIAKLLYSDSNIEIKAFQEKFLTDDGRLKKDSDNTEIGKYDIVIGNPPYKPNEGKYKAIDNKNKAARLEEYFIDRGLDLLKDGGVLVYVIPRGVLNNATSTVKEAIAKKGNLVDAYRLPDGIFQDTGVGTDIIVIKKEVGNIEDFTDGNFFKNNPEKVLGELSDKKGQWGSDIYTGDISALDKIDVKKNVIKRVSEKTDSKPTKGALTEKKDKNMSKNMSKKKVVAESNIKYSEYIPENKMPEKELTVWQNTNNDNSVDLPLSYDPSLLNYYNGKVYHNFYYLEGNLYLKLEQLEADKDNISEAQYKKQKELIEKSLIKQNINEFTVNPLSKFGKILMSGVTKIDTRWGKNGREEFERETSATEEFEDYLKTTSTEDREGFDTSDLMTLSKGDEAFPTKSPRKNWEGKTIPLTKEEIKFNQRQIERQAKSRNILEKIFNDYLRNELSPEAKQKIEEKFNKEFNAVVNPDYMELPLLIKGMSETFKGKPLKLQWQQLKGVNFLTAKGTGCLAYGTGIGKTITGIIATVQNMQMGRCKRPVFIVPANTLKKWIFETKELFPDIKINNFGNMGTEIQETQVEDGSLTFITHEAFTNLWYKNPEIIEDFKQEAYSQSTRPEILGMIPQSDKAKKQKERALDKAESFISEAKSALNNSKREKLFYVDKLGFDHITVDETHLSFVKSVFDGIAGRNAVRGTSGTTSKSGAGMFLLHQYILKNNDYRNVFHLTATPFENRIIEIYNMLSYVGRYRLDQMGLLNAHDFIEYFIDVESRLVPTNDMSDIKAEKQIRGFKNAAVFKRLIAEFIDYESSAEVNKPEKHVRTVELNKSFMQEDKTQESKDLVKTLKQRGGKEGKAAALIYMTKERLNNISPYLADMPKTTEKEARKEYIKSISPKEFVENSPKIMYSVEAIKAVLEDDPKTSQILYLDTGIDFFGHIKKYIIERDILKANEIVTSEEIKDKQKIADMLNDRENPVKLLIGSSKISTGMDLQENTSVLYNISNDYNPTTQVQIEGRLWRQGNAYKNVRVIYPFIKNSSDVFMFRILADKTARLNDIYSKSGDNYIDVSEVNPDQYLEELVTDPDFKYALYVDSQKNILEQKQANLEDKIKSIETIADSYKYSQRMLERTKKELPETEKTLSEWKQKSEMNPSYNFYKDKVEEFSNQVKRNKYDIKKYENKVDFLKKRIELNKIDVENVDKIREFYNKEILEIQDKINNIEANAELKKVEFKKQFEEMQEKAPSIKDLIKEVKEDNKILLTRKEPEMLKGARRGSVYLGEVSSLDEIKERIVKSFAFLKPAWDYFLKYGFDPRRYFIAKAMGGYHIVESRKIQVESNTPKSNDTFAHQDLFARMRTILSKNTHTKQIYLDAKDKENNFSKLLNTQKELLIEVEHGIGESLPKLIDIMEGKKKAVTQKEKELTGLLRKTIDKQGERVLNTLLDSGYLRPKTEILNGKATQVYTADGQTLIGEAYGQKEVDKIFRDYMHANWKKENYFPHVFKGFYPVIAELKEKDLITGKNKTHFIGRAYTTTEAKIVYNEYIADHSNQYSDSDFTGKVTLDTSLSKDDNEYVLVGLPDLKKIKDRLNDEDLEFNLTTEEMADIQSLFVPKRDVKKARKTGFAEKREDYEGYIKDPIEALEAYFYGTEKFIQDADFLKKATANITRAKLAGIQSQQPNLYNQTLAYIRAVTGDRYVDEKAIADVTKFVFESVLNKPNAMNYNWYPKAMKAIRGFEYKAKLGIRLDHLIIQPALTWINVYPELSAKGKNKLDGEKYLYKGIQKTAQFLFDKDLQSLVKKSDLLNAGFVESMESALSGNLGLKRKFELAQLRWNSNNKKKAIKDGLELMGDVWMASFSLGDKSPRLTAFFGRMQQLLDEMNYKSIEEAKKDGMLDFIIKESTDFADETNFKYSVTDAPALFRSQTGKTLLQFKQFMIFQLGLWKDMAMRDFPKLSRAIKTQNFDLLAKSTPLAKSMLFAFLLFGATGLPFSQDISNALAKFMPDNALLEARQNDFIRAGAPSLVGIDLSASGDVRLQQFIPVDDTWKLDVTRIAPAVGTGKNIVDYINNIGELGLEEATDKVAQREFIGYKRLVKGKFLSFKSIEESKEQFIKYEYSRANKARMKNLVKAEARGDKENMQKIITKISKSGYYKDYNSFQKGFNTTKNYMISKDSEKAIGAFQKKNKAVFISETRRIAKKWYGGDIDKTIEKLSAKIDKQN